MFAAVGSGEIKNLTQAGQLVRVSGRYTPDETNCAVYERNYAVFKRLYAANQKNFALLNRQ